jgi:hypothetical protein
MTAIADQLTDIASQLVTLANQTSATPDDAEALARRFHEAYERLAPAFGYQTREASAKPWEQVPDNNRALMTAVCAELLADRTPPQASPSYRAFLGEPPCSDPNCPCHPKPAAPQEARTADAPGGAA